MVDGSVADNLLKLQANMVMMLDTKAINYILTHSHDYPKPDMMRFALSKIVGPGMCPLVLRFPVIC